MLRYATTLFTICLSAAPALADVTMSIPFVAEIGGKPFSCAEVYPLGTHQTEAGILDFRMFVANAVLVTKDDEVVPIVLDADGAWQSGNVALLDFEDGSGHCANGTPQTNTTLRGTVPEGDYKWLRFEVGVPFELNHGDPTTAPSPLNMTAMFWNWRNGYKFIKLEASPTGMTDTAMTDAGEPDGHGSKAGDWFLHLGSTLCESLAPIQSPGQPCLNPNRVSVNLEGIDLGKSVVVVDPAPVLAATDIATNAPETSPGCMSAPDDADCAAVLPRLGLPFGDAPAAEQVLVTLR